MNIATIVMYITYTIYSSRLLFRGYFAEALKRSDLSNLLSASASPTAVKEANEAVKSDELERKSNQRGSYAKFKTAKIYSQGILVNYTTICSKENFPLYSTIYGCRT